MQKYNPEWAKGNYQKNRDKLLFKAKQKRETVNKDPDKRQKKLEYSREYYRQNAERLKEQARLRSQRERQDPERKKVIYARAVASKRKAREDVIKHYGGCCTCCGESRYEFLAIDHVNGGGTALRRSKKQTSDQIVWEIKRENYPKDYRILCHNCNQALGIYGYCPHNDAFK